jgi:hypothetical protein
MQKLIQSCRKLSSVTSFLYKSAVRPSHVITHRNELLPFTPNNLWDNPKSRRTPKRLGRGPGSGKGKTSGRGHKGHKARSGGG